MVRAVAQRFERRGQPHRQQRVELEFGLAIRRELNRPCFQHRDVSLVQVWKLGGAGHHLLAPGDVLFAHRPRRRDLALDQVLLKRSEYAAGLFGLLEQRPCRFAKRLR